MGRQEQQLIRDGYAAFARGDMEWIRRTLHPDFELHTIFVSTGSDVYRGPDALVEYAADMADAWETWNIDVVDLLDAGNEVVAVVAISARGRGSGVTLHQRFAVVWSFRDGKLLQAVSYASVDEAMRAAGLEP